MGLVAIQRKRFPDDFLASVVDGRLMREVALLRTTKTPILIIEGRETYSSDGSVARSFNIHWHKKQIRNLFRSIRLEYGISIEFTDDIGDTAETVIEMDNWFQKTEHNSLLTRPKDVKNGWGRISERDFARFLLQGFPNIGPKQADKIYDHFGRIPLKWDCSADEMLVVEGIGNKKVESLFGCLRQTWKKR